MAVSSSLLNDSGIVPCENLWLVDSIVDLHRNDRWYKPHVDKIDDTMNGQ